MKREPRIIVDCPEGVYKPAEDSELLLGSFNPKHGGRVLEVGTGSGFVALHCAAAGNDVTATDASRVAAACARMNAEANGLPIEVVVCDLAGAVRGPFDAVLFNPPYLPGRLGQASADGGIGGVEVLASLLRDLPRVLAPGGECLVVLSSHSDTTSLIAKFPSLDFQLLATKKLFFETLSSYRICEQKDNAI